MTEPNIVLANSAAMTDTGLNGTISSSNFKMEYLLYADDSAFDNWTDWVNDSVNSPTQKNLDNASTFSNYVLKIKCNLVAVNHACGFASSDKGAILIESNTAGEIAAVATTSTADSNTYTMTAA